MSDQESSSVKRPTWDERVLAELPPGVDGSQIAERLLLTPTERLERMVSFLRFLEEARAPE